jgi:hypothetical protein
VSLNNLRERKYIVLLVALLLLIVIFPMLRGVEATRLLYQALTTAVFLIALLTVFTSHHRVAALLLGVPTLIGLWTDYGLLNLPRLPVVLSFHGGAALFLGFAVGVILADVYRQERISGDSVCGVLCGYLLLGLGFAHLYCMMESIVPGSFQFPDKEAGYGRDQGLLHFKLTYFSLVTLTTVGYGDITPVKEATRGLAVVEAMIGQFYIAVLLGELIGKRVSQVLAEKQAGPR